MIQKGEDRESKAKKELEEKWIKDINIIKDINAKAIRISSRVNKQNFASNYNIGQFREFSNKAAPILAFRNDSQIGYISGNIYFILALDLINQGQFKDASNYLREASKIAEQPASTFENKIDYIFPEKEVLSKVGGIEAWNKSLSNELLFHEALISFRVGKYQKAENLFQRAAKFDPKDHTSLIFKAESKYWGQYTSFEDVIDEFLGLEELIEASSSSDILLANLYNYIGNCYFPSDQPKLSFSKSKKFERSWKNISKGT